MTVDEALDVADGLYGGDLVVTDALRVLAADVRHRRATVTTGGPPPGYHWPGQWRAPTFTPPPDSATTGPATPTRKDTP